MVMVRVRLRVRAARRPPCTKLGLELGSVVRLRVRVRARVRVRVGARGHLVRRVVLALLAAEARHHGLELGEVDDAVLGEG